MREVQPDRLKGCCVEATDEWQTGAYSIPGPFNAPLLIVASREFGWEHVSVSLRNRCPNWPEMCFIKDLFWGEDEIVIQYHPPKKDYINIYPYCLHMWRPTEKVIPVPEKWMIG